MAGLAGTTGAHEGKAAAPTRGCALGLNVEAPAGFSGLRGAAGPNGDRCVSVDIVAQAHIAVAWAAAGVDERQGVAALPDASSVRTDHHPAVGYLITASDGCRCLVDLDGRRIRAAAGPYDNRRWQRLVATQALPLAATLHGLEVFSASAVVVAGQVVAFAGPAGVGKSGVAARLMLVGARFFADDLIALDVQRGQIVAHAGLGVVRLGEGARSTVPQLAAQGVDVIGRDDKTLVECSRDVASLPLRGLYLLGPAPAGAEPEIAVHQPASSRLLASTHNHSVRTPERLRRHLDLVALVGAHVGIFSATAPPGAERELARAIFQHAALAVLL